VSEKAKMPAVDGNAGLQTEHGYAGWHPAVYGIFASVAVRFILTCIDMDHTSVCMIFAEACKQESLVSKDVESRVFHKRQMWPVHVIEYELVLSSSQVTHDLNPHHEQSFPIHA